MLICRHLFVQFERLWHLFFFPTWTVHLRSFSLKRVSTSAIQAMAVYVNSLIKRSFFQAFRTIHFVMTPGCMPEKQILWYSVSNQSHIWELNLAFGFFWTHFPSQKKGGKNKIWNNFLGRLLVLESFVHLFIMEINLVHCEPVESKFHAWLPFQHNQKRNRNIDFTKVVLSWKKKCWTFPQSAVQIIRYAKSNCQSKRNFRAQRPLWISICSKKLEMFSEW